MPGSVANAGLADAFLPLDQIAPELIRCGTGSRPVRRWDRAPASYRTHGDEQADTRELRVPPLQVARPKIIGPAASI